MLQNIPSKKVRLNVQIPFELKDKLTWASVIEGKKDVGFGSGIH
ncbi:MAG: hypothetical protein U9N58_02360 [Thermodesulfobacteriota bacterium]|nr:hypothetical protein [Thermodesulfobacteriota bacterium]